MQVCASHQTDNYASTPLLSFLQAICPSCHQANSVKALKLVLTVDCWFWFRDECDLAVTVLRSYVNRVFFTLYDWLMVLQYSYLLLAQLWFTVVCFFLYR